MSDSFSPIKGISTETVFNIEDQLKDILNSLNTGVLNNEPGYQVYLMLFHYKDNCFYNYSKRRYVWDGDGQREDYNFLEKFNKLFESNFGNLGKDLLKNYKFNGGKDFIENNLKKITNDEVEYNVCNKLLSLLKNNECQKTCLTKGVMSYQTIMKQLDIDKNKILRDSLLKIFRSLPQPKNALIAGWFYSYISQKNTGGKTNTNCFKVLDPDNNIIFIPNMKRFLDNYKNEQSFNINSKALKYYFDDCYPLAKFLEELLVIGDSLDTDALNKMSAVLSPLYDFGQLRGLIYVVADNEYIAEGDCDICNNSPTKSLKIDKAEEITAAIRKEQERYRLNIRDAMKCELNKRVFKDNLEDDVYTKILRNLHLVQNILLGVYSSFEDDKFKPVALRSFKKLKNNISQFVYLDEDNLKDKEDITLENGQSVFKIKKYSRDLKTKINVKEPNVYYAEDGTGFLIQTNSAYCNNIGSEIGLEILVPIVADRKLKGTFDLYFPPMKDPGSTEDHVRAIVEHLRTFLSLGGVHDEMVTRVTEHSIRAAVSAIISRNHSHHIGSHVTPRSSVKKISERLETFDSKKTETVNCKLKLMKKEREFKFVNLLKNRLDEYIQKKADFTAEIATEPLITTKSLSFVREIFIPLLKNTLLMDGIGANEEVQYKSLTDNRLKVKCFLDSEELDFSIKSDCTKKEHTYKYYNYPYNGHCECVNARELKIIEEDFPDKKIALPGPLGEFSFYCFMENFIRNAIKHNRTKLDQNKDSDMEIFVNLEELDKNHPDRDEFYKIQVWDNMTNPCESRTILINGEEKPVVLKDMIAHLIKQPIVDNDGGLKKGAWGIAEMKVMATLLRGSTDFVNMANNLKVCCHNKDGKERLVYELYVMKAKHTAIVTNNNFDNDTEKNLNKNGIWIFKDLNEFDTHITGGKSPASFKFVLLDLNNIGENVLSEFLPKFPFRIFTKEFLDKNNFKIENSIGSSDETIEEFKRTIWKVYLKNLFDKKNLSNSQIDLILFLQQAKNEFPTNEWKKREKQKIKWLSKLNLKVISKEDEDNSVCLNSNLSLMYDRHAGGHKKITKSNRDNICFYESFDKSSHDFTSIFLKPESEEMIYELAEAAILRVLVIDERVAERAHEEIKVEEDVLKKFYDPGNSKPMRIQIARKAKVYFCTHFSINNNKRPLHNKAEGEVLSVEVKMSVSQNDEFSIDSFEVIYGNSESNENGGIFDIVIIHQGVLEEFVKKVLGSYSYEDFLKSLRKHIPHIIVTSGRGIPPNLPKSAKFIPFSLLEDYLLRGGIAKYNLVKIVTELIRRDV